jgi:endonuclease G
MRFTAFALALLLAGCTSAGHRQSTVTEIHPVALEQECLKNFPGQVPPKSEATAGRTICYEQFALFASSETKTPLWVAENLTPEEVHTGLARKDAFHAEPRLPSGSWAELKDYRNSGFARGHMAPSADMATPTAQYESFSLANMVPQDTRNNSGPWKAIETKVRDMAAAEPLFVVTGPVYVSGGMPRVIGDNRIAVPFKLYKAVYQPATGITGAYVMTNESRPECRRISINDLTALTGINVFPDLPADILDRLDLLPSPKGLNCRIG